jgi:hypothetical protein
MKIAATAWTEVLFKHLLGNIDENEGKSQLQYEHRLRTTRDAWLLSRG